jgi:NADP-dependent 3-hydroxy acid dehydrogenase YdfG
MAIDKSRPVLITGCSTGIGRATAEKLAKDGWNVYATARKPEDIEDLKQAGAKTLALDVTPATARAARSRPSRWKASGGSSRQTSSA